MKISHLTPLNRRDAMRLLLTGTGATGIAALTQHVPWAAGGTQQAAAPRSASGVIVRTLLKDLPPEELGNGAVLLHEHLSLGGPKPPEEVARIVELVKKAGRDGVSCVADVGMSDLGRDVDMLKQIASQTTVHIVMGGGYSPAHADLRQRHPDILTKTEEQIADDLVRDATAARQGVFGEIGTGNLSGDVASTSGPMSDLERKVFRAIGRAHVRTGLPIITHTAYHRVPDAPKNFGLEQVDAFESVGVNLQNVVIGHLCCTNDPAAEQAKAIAKRGAFIGFDRVTTQPVPDETKVRMVQALLDAGLGNRLILASDFIATRRNLDTPPPPGPGLERTVTVFVPLLRKAGITEAAIHDLTVNNPRRVLAFVPKNG
jgi:phosphotriesterase-related protein